MSLHQQHQQHVGRHRHSHHSQYSPSKWKCIECTYENPHSSARCDMCLTAKPIAPITPISPQIPSNQSNSHSRSNSNKKAMGITFSTHYDAPNPHKNGYNKNQNQSKPEDINICAVYPSKVQFNPTKPVPKQSIFERWMIAQLERASGEQPNICIANNVMLTNLRRVRAPTTVRTLQQQINQNTNAYTHANHLDAGDFTDDEEDELSSALYPSNSPRSQNSQNLSFGFSPSPTSDNEEDYGPSFGARLLAKKKGAQSHVPSNGRERVKREEFDRTLSHDDIAYKQKQLLNERRRKKKRNRHKKQQTISGLWFKAQSELTQGRNPQILNKYNITLTNIRQHNPRFQDYQRRKSHHEKAINYLEVTGDKLHTNNRTHIANDDDADDDMFSDTENDSDINTPTPLSGYHRNGNGYHRNGNGNGNSNNNWSEYAE